MEILGIILVAIVIIICAVYLAWKSIGDADVQFKLSEHTPFVLDKIEADKAIFSTKVEIANDGRQCATIMDCFVRSQLPYEQFDGAEVKAKAERENSPREDNYFESVLIQKYEKINVIIKIELIDRKGKGIKETLRHAVDVPVDVVYQHTARYAAVLSKKRLVLPAAEIASLLNIELLAE